jgi:glyoxylase-like metal-dependent hydrolase (beta-lactamase superfamily II)
MEKMKKKKSRIILPIVAVVLVLLGFLLYQPIRSMIALVSMKPLQTGEVMTDIYAVNNGFVNLYLFKSGDKYIVFDAGNDNKATEVALGQLGVSPNDVIAVFLTHTDGDHVMGVTLFPAAEIYTSDNNREFLLNATGMSRSNAFLKMEPNYKTLTDGETVLIGETEIMCIYTPGHTPGSASYLADEKYLFTGDNLHLKNGKAVLFSDVFNMDNYVQEQSLRKLANLTEIEAVFSMHSGYTTDFSTAFSEWMQ